MPYRYREGFWTASMAGRVCAALLAAIARCVVCQTRLPLHKQMHRNASRMTVARHEGAAGDVRLDYARNKAHSVLQPQTQCRGCCCEMKTARGETNFVVNGAGC